MSEFSTNIITITHKQFLADAVLFSSMSQSSGSSDTVPDELLPPRHYLLMLLSKSLFFQLCDEAIVRKIVSFVPVQREYAPMPKRMQADRQLQMTDQRTNAGAPAVRRDFMLPS